MLATKPAAWFVFWGRLQTVLYTRLLASSFACFGRHSRIEPRFRYANLHLISIGKQVIINRDCWILAQRTSDQDDLRPKLFIEDRCVIGMGATISAAHLVKLEQNVLLARNVYISDHGHAFENCEIPIMDQGISVPREVTVGRDTWLGQNVVVLPGSQIGRHCVVGANSVIRGVIPDFSVAVGSPARVVRRFDALKGVWVK